MPRRLNDLIGYKLVALDGPVGEISDIFFEDRAWSVRYCVVAPDRASARVLISPAALGSPDWPGRLLAVRLKVETVRQSPPVDSDRPVSRRYEMALHDYYQWQYYWRDPGLDPSAEAGLEAGDPDLRSVREVTGYEVAAADGPAGRLADVLVDEGTWKVTHMVIDTHPELGARGGRLWLPTDRVARVSWTTSRLVLELSCEDLRRDPALLRNPE